MVKKIKITEDTWLSHLIEKPSFKMIFPEDSYEEPIIDPKKRGCFYYTKIPVAHVKTIRTLEKMGFYLVDTNVQLDQVIGNRSVLSGKTIIRVATEKDEDPAAFVARDNFVYTRFHLDENIENNYANKIKEEWVRNYFHNKRGDNMIIATINNKVVGFLQLIYQETLIIIDLIAVDKDYRGQSIAKDMIIFAMQDERFERILVGTQIANIPSLRLYESLGFKMCNSQYVFHYHS